MGRPIRRGATPPHCNPAHTSLHPPTAAARNKPATVCVQALRRGCVPLDIKPLGSGRPLAPFVPHDRFSLLVDDDALRGFPRSAAGALRAAAGAREMAARLTAALANLTLPRLNAMRCEMACAATHMSWGAPAPASCAGPAAHVAGVVPTLLTLLLNRRVPPARQLRARRCPCDAPPDSWHYFAHAGG